MTIDKREEIIRLYDTYQCLLTDKQRNYFEEYYFDDFSITEIAENHQISRNAVFDQVKRVAGILQEYEEKLKLVKKRTAIEALALPEAIRSEIIEIIKE